MYNCQREADVFYVGETKRHLGIRALEHIRGTPFSTAVTSHINECIDCQQSNSTRPHHKNFKIIKSGTSKFDVQILEALIIKRLSPKLNLQLHNAGSSFTLRIFS